MSDQRTCSDGKGYVTTEDCCSECGTKLHNAETSRLEWQAEAHRLKSTLAEKDKELVSLRNDVVILNEALAVKHIPQLNAIMVRNTEIDQLRTDAATKDKTIGELRACLGECVQALKGWHDYFQKDIATTADQQHEQGEQFTDAWFNAESAIAKSTSILSTQSDKGEVK